MRIGIDFGTTFSLPAGMINGAPVTLLPGGEYGIPSVFYYDEYAPQNAVRNIKMEISEHTGNFELDGRTFTKKEIVRHILKEVATTARNETERRQLTSQSIEGAVITVPAKFQMPEMNFIKEVAEDSGIKVLGIIPEPVAAAIAYFKAPNAEDKKTIMVYDLGGGTCDVAIVRADKNAEHWYTVIDSNMRRIGGRNWDKNVVEVIKKECRKKNPNVTFDDEAEGRIYKAAVTVKENLSTLEKAQARVNIKGRTYTCMITREEFEQATKELMQTILKMVREMVQNCSSKIDYIVCVGGSSNMPQVKQMLQKDNPDIEIKLYEPEKAIAFGATIYAENLFTDNFLRDICRFSYGARYVEDYDKYHDLDRLRVYNIIYRDTPLPASGKSSSYKIHDGDQTYIAIYESDCKDYQYLPENGTQIGEIRIEGVHDAKKDDETKLTMTIEKNGLMTLKAVDQRTQTVAVRKNHWETVTILIQMKLVPPLNLKIINIQRCMAKAKSKANPFHKMSNFQRQRRQIQIFLA